MGYHTLQARSLDHEAAMPLIVTPAWLGFPERMGDRRAWGLATQLYSVRSAQSWGVGDLADLEDLAVWSAAVHGADYVLVNSDSTLQDKQSYLEDFKVPGFRLDPYELQQPVRKIWGDAALLAGIVRLSWTLKGEHHERLLRIAHVWTRQDSRWQLAYTQLTRIPEQ